MFVLLPSLSLLGSNGGGGARLQVACVFSTNAQSVNVRSCCEKNKEDESYF